MALANLASCRDTLLLSMQIDARLILERDKLSLSAIIVGILSGITSSVSIFGALATRWAPLPERQLAGAHLARNAATNMVQPHAIWMLGGLNECDTVFLENGACQLAAVAGTGVKADAICPDRR
jgi:hypothetical protein